MRMLRWVVLASAWCVVRAACPAPCHCLGGEDQLIECHLPPNKTFSVTMQPSSYIKFTCMKGSEDIGCEDIPELPHSSPVVRSASVKRCSLAGGVRCLLARGGVTSLHTLTLEGTASVTLHQLQGLTDLRNLYFYYADAQITVPLSGLSAPHLEQFRLNGAHLTLSPNMFTNTTPSLTYLELSNDGISAIPPGTFAGLEHLTSLNMFGNQIGELLPGALEGLDSLEKLCLNTNNLTRISPGVFSFTPRLKQVKMLWIFLEELSAEVFTGHPAIEAIQIHNRVPLALGGHALAQMAVLKDLDLSSCKIQELPPDLWELSNALVNITLRKNNIEELPVDLFKHQVALKKLDLSHNKMTAINATVFNSLKSLIELNLDYNSIEALPEFMFAGLLNLESVSIDGNGLQYIEDNAFSGARALKILSLSENKLTLLPANPGSYQLFPGQSPFYPLARLQLLDLSHNNISVMFSDWTNVLALTLDRLDLSWNSFTSLHFDTDLTFLSNILVNLTHNRITTVTFSTNNYGAAFLTDDGVTDRSTPTVLLGDNPFDCDCRLYHMIDLYNNDVYVSRRIRWDFNNSECATPKSLVSFGLLKVPMDEFTCEVPDKICPKSCSCRNRAKTSELEMICDSLVEVPPPETVGAKSVNVTLTKPPDSLRNMSSRVTELSLRGLGLEKVPEVPPGLKVLDLSDNNLTEIPVQLIRGTNATLRLKGNRFDCDCFNSEDVEFFNRHSFRVQDYKKITCRGGGAIANENAERLCSLLRGALIGSLLAAVGVAVAVAITVLHRYRLAIKIFLYNRGWFPVREDELDEGKLYDAFVSFAHRDEKFVVERLLPELEEGPEPFKVCVHHRDWVVGDWIPAQIVRSVENSRRTVVVLSESFLDSVWGKLEFRAAHLQAIKDGRVRVIIVLLDDVLDDPRIDSELRTYLSTNTYVKWGDPWFWDKLRYALPHRQKVKDRSSRNAIEEKADDDRVVELFKELQQKGGLHVQLTPDGKLVNAAHKV